MPNLFKLDPNRKRRRRRIIDFARGGTQKLCLAGLVFVTVAATTYGQRTATPVISLAGEWRFMLDPENTGVPDQWFNKFLPDRISLPGILQAQNYGYEISTTTP